MRWNCIFPPARTVGKANSYVTSTKKWGVFLSRLLLSAFAGKIDCNSSIVAPFFRWFEASPTKFAHPYTDKLKSAAMWKKAICSPERKSMMFSDPGNGKRRCGIFSLLLHPGTKIKGHQCHLWSFCAVCLYVFWSKGRTGIFDAKTEPIWWPKEMFRSDWSGMPPPFPRRHKTVNVFYCFCAHSSFPRNGMRKLHTKSKASEEAFCFLPLRSALTSLALVRQSMNVFF